MTDNRPLPYHTPTIDRERRDKLAQLLRHLLTGRISIDHYVNQADELCMPLEVRDFGLLEIQARDLYLYEAFWDCEIAGECALPRDVKHHFAKWILFLYSDQEYRWDEIDHAIAQARKLNILTLGLWNRLFAGDIVAKNQIVHDNDAWPFQTFTHLEDAKRRPRLLNGR